MCKSRTMPPRWSHRNRRTVAAVRPMQRGNAWRALQRYDRDLGGTRERMFAGLFYMPGGGRRSGDLHRS
ncbi:MAG: hypothetical protein AcusKO_09080 [Acuticoccus sp.]